MGIFIDHVEFENYRQYGTGKLSFNKKNKKMLYAVIAKNGTGKTTLLNAITWCLYNKEYQIDDKSKALPLINTAVFQKANHNDEITVSVKLLIVDDDEKKNIEFTRIQTFKIVKTHAGNKKAISNDNNFIVTFTGEHENTEPQYNSDAQPWVKQYFDEDIRNFYFFDGEQLKEFFGESKSKAIKDSIYNIAQITLLEKCIKRIKDIRKDLAKEIAKDYPSLSSIEEEINKKKERIEFEKGVLRDCENELAELVPKREAIESELKHYEPIKALKVKQAEYLGRLNKLDDEATKFKKDKADFVRRYVVLLNMYPSIKKTYDLIVEKEKKGELPPDIDKDLVLRLLEKEEATCPICNGKINENARSHLKALLNKITVSSITANELSRTKGPLEACLEETGKFEEKLTIFNKRENELERDIKHEKDLLQEVNAKLLTYGNASETFDVAAKERESQNLQSQINQLYIRQGGAGTRYRDFVEDLAALNKKWKDAFSKQKGLETKKREINLLDDLENHYSLVMNNIINEILQEISFTTQRIFDEMIWKKNTFGKVSINGDYEVEVHNKNNVLMTASLSATEKMALAYAFTLAVHRASGKNCPLVIDSPLGRVSDENRGNMARSLLEISTITTKQLIMLFTPDEYSEEVKVVYDNKVNVQELKLSMDETHVEGV